MYNIGLECEMARKVLVVEVFSLIGPLATSRHPIFEILDRHPAIARWRGLVWRDGEVEPTSLTTGQLPMSCTKKKRNGQEAVASKHRATVPSNKFSLSRDICPTKHWSVESLRVIGHVAYSPPITVGAGAERYTEDWALIELNRNKIDWNNFKEWFATSLGRRQVQQRGHQ
ncbi:hypothetical protein BDZ97DRAFT_2059034 [Flammula alnicola]|nr:hypothetical protein BDZ97DRAFT_2059034 [Flammula alnicola]